MDCQKERQQNSDLTTRGPETTKGYYTMFGLAGFGYIWRMYSPIFYSVVPKMYRALNFICYKLPTTENSSICLGVSFILLFCWIRYNHGEFLNNKQHFLNCYLLIIPSLLAGIRLLVNKTIISYLVLPNTLGRNLRKSFTEKSTIHLHLSLNLWLLIATCQDTW